jgi:hypothetical protein
MKIKPDFILCTNIKSLSQIKGKRINSSLKKCKFVVTSTIRVTKVSAFILNNQPDALIVPILFCYKTLHVSGIFSAHHQEFSTVHSALLSFMQVYDDRFQAESGWNWNSSILTLLGSGHHKPARNLAVPNVQ